MCTVFDENNSLLGAVLGDLLDIEREVATNVDDPREARMISIDRFPKGARGHTQIVLTTVYELDSASSPPGNKRYGHVGVGWTQYDSIAHVEELKHGKSSSSPARE